MGLGRKCGHGKLFRNGAVGRITDMPSHDTMQPSIVPHHVFDAPIIIVYTILNKHGVWGIKEK